MKRLSLAVVCIIFAGCATTTVMQKTATTDLPYRDITLSSPDGKDMKLSVQVAGLPAEQEDGLMFRDRLDDGKGMLFAFEKQQSLTFWMKNTLIPLDVIYFDADGKFVSTQSMVPCASDPCATYPSGKPALFALEVNAGFAAQNGIGDGWKIDQR